MKRKLIFLVTQDADLCYRAKCLSEEISAHGKTIEDLRHNINEMVQAHFFHSELQNFQIVLRTQ
jgi:hypothetical protein